MLQPFAILGRTDTVTLSLCTLRWKITHAMQTRKEHALKNYPNSQSLKLEESHTTEQTQVLNSHPVQGRCLLNPNMWENLLLYWIMVFQLLTADCSAVNLRSLRKQHYFQRKLYIYG